MDEQIEMQDINLDDDDDINDIDNSSLIMPEQELVDPNFDQQEQHVEILTDKEYMLLKLKKDLWRSFDWPSENVKLSIDDRQLSEKNIIEKDGIFYFKVTKSNGDIKEIKLNRYKGSSDEVLFY